MSYEGYHEWKGWDKDQFGRYDKGEDLFYDLEVATLLPSPSESVSSIFEIGFGNGSFLGWAREKQYDVFGSELQPELIGRALDMGFIVKDGIENMPASSLSAVVAFDVFEHIPYTELLKTCKFAFSALKPGGYLIARFPNGDSPFSLPIQNADVTHVHALGSGIIRELMRSAGFVIEELRAPKESPVTLKSKIALPIKKVMRSLFAYYVRFAYLGGATPSTFALNYLLVARKPHKV
ncbi:MAG: methyltransferase domain-containing protein [Mesorhizobium sp.]|uniref:class I SAM-dependent methyltransferase n=1 Tax=unclassified Mesorhizobium TaxID=325217 RepID=UPI000FE3503D|nr:MULTISPECIES: class I SAM-dependent methyltransferase [unclassified Mesorhizobium]RWC92982.1 MAG: class I SAM-dependent methyltransferase [Mesorhizobium sp.]RWX68031.1 class I SAM-dependent methyltransferase [Mesorhizobium sp. M4B.F.Ca.ET.089.01.1.1]TIW74790.1 MAG: methyltransferase domain-containing protein [Mesorhizobium sp.]